VTGVESKSKLHVEELDVESGESGAGCSCGLLSRKEDDIFERGGDDKERDVNSAGKDFLQGQVGMTRGGSRCKPCWATIFLVARQLSSVEEMLVTGISAKGGEYMRV